MDELWNRMRTAAGTWWVVPAGCDYALPVQLQRDSKQTSDCPEARLVVSGAIHRPQKIATCTIQFAFVYAFH